MDSMQRLVMMLFTTSLTNPEIAKRCGRHRRTVSRYRRLANGLTWEEVQGLDGRTLKALFNRRTPAYRHAWPPFESLAALGNGTLTVYDQWGIHTDYGHRPHSLSLTQFRKRHRAWQAAGGAPRTRAVTPAEEGRPCA